MTVLLFIALLEIFDRRAKHRMLCNKPAINAFLQYAKLHRLNAFIRRRVGRTNCDCRKLRIHKIAVSRGRHGLRFRSKGEISTQKIAVTKMEVHII